MTFKGGRIRVRDKSAVEDECTVYRSDLGGGLRAYQLESAELISVHIGHDSQCIVLVPSP